MEMNARNLGVAIQIAATSHCGQFDKAGEPYILHPLRVMERMTTHEERVVGVLHDVIEDTWWTLDNLRACLFSDAVIGALDHLTHRLGEDYEAYIERIKAGPDLARRVKMADLSDNLNKNRIPFPSKRDLKRWEKYERAYARLTESAS